MAEIFIFLWEWVYDVTTCSLSAPAGKSPTEYIVLQRALKCSVKEDVGVVELCCAQVNFVMFVYGQ
jgi:hypothetical protein